MISTYLARLTILIIYILNYITVILLRLFVFSSAINRLKII